MGNHERGPVLSAHLDLAKDRLKSNPDEALQIVTGTNIRAPFGLAWLSFARSAEQADATAMAAYAYNEAALSLPSSEAWRAAARALPLQGQRMMEAGIGPEEQLLRALEAAEVALNAAGGLAFIQDDQERNRYELAVSGFATALGKMAVNHSLLQPPPQGWRELHGSVKRIFLRLADNSEGGVREALHLYESATAWWRQVKADDLDPDELKAVAARYRQALIVARGRGEKRLELHIKAWFVRRGLPEPILADEEGDD